MQASSKQISELQAEIVSKDEQISARDKEITTKGEVSQLLRSEIEVRNLYCHNQRTKLHDINHLYIIIGTRYSSY